MTKASSRATLSVGPPAAKGTIKVIGRSPGNSAACEAGAMKQMLVNTEAVKTSFFINCITSPC